MKKPKPGVSPNPLVTGGKTLPKLSGPVGGMPNKPVGPTRLTPRPLPPGRSANAGGLVGGMAPKATAAVRNVPQMPKKAVPAPLQATRVGGVASKMGTAPKVQPKPVIRSTAKPAMPTRKK